MQISESGQHPSEQVRSGHMGNVIRFPTEKTASAKSGKGPSFEELIHREDMLAFLNNGRNGFRTKSIEEEIIQLIEEALVNDPNRKKKSTCL